MSDKFPRTRSPTNLDDTSAEIILNCPGDPNEEGGGGPEDTEDINTLIQSQFEERPAAVPPVRASSRSRVGTARSVTSLAMGVGRCRYFLW